MASYEKIDDLVGRTSTVSATARANESKRADALVRDLFAPVYAGSIGPQTMETFARDGNTTTELITTDIAVRTRFIDDLLQETAQTIKQIVILACGGDFRPYRLSWAESSTPVEFYLLDMTEVLVYRQKCLDKLPSPPLAINAKVVEIACNLANEEWPSKLVEHHFRPDQPTLWIAEGFFHYLVKEDIQRLFERIRQLSAKDSSIIFDLVPSRSKELLSVVRFAIDDEQEVHEIFNKFGCEDIVCTPFAQIGLMHGRTVSRGRTFIVRAKLCNKNLSGSN